MTPQHSSLPGRAFPRGMTAQAYTCMKCYLLHHNAKSIAEQVVVKVVLLDMAIQ